MADIFSIDGSRIGSNSESVSGDISADQSFEQLTKDRDNGRFQDGVMFIGINDDGTLSRITNMSYAEIIYALEVTKAAFLRDVFEG